MASATATTTPIGCTPAGADDFSEILSWCKRERFRFPKCAIEMRPDTGRAFVAAADIKEGELVVELPDDAVLMAENCSITELLEGEP